MERGPSTAIRPAGLLSFPAAKKGMLAADTSFMVMLRVRLGGFWRGKRCIEPLFFNRSELVGGFEKY